MQEKSWKKTNKQKNPTRWPEKYFIIPFGEGEKKHKLIFVETQTYFC